MIRTGQYILLLIWIVWVDRYMGRTYDSLEEIRDITYQRSSASTGEYIAVNDEKSHGINGNKLSLKDRPSQRTYEEHISGLSENSLIDSVTAIDDDIISSYGQIFIRMIMNIQNYLSNIYTLQKRVSEVEIIDDLRNGALTARESPQDAKGKVNPVSQIQSSSYTNRINDPSFATLIEPDSRTSLRSDSLWEDLSRRLLTLIPNYSFDLVRGVQKLDNEDRESLDTNLRSSYIPINDTKAMSLDPPQISLQSSRMRLTNASQPNPNPNNSPKSPSNSINSLDPTTVFILIAVVILAPALIVAINISYHIHKLRRQQRENIATRGIFDVAIASEEVAATLPAAEASLHSR